MASIQLPEDVYTVYSRFADEFETFDNTDELVLFVLTAMAEDLEHNANQEWFDSPNSEDIEDRLRHLGYIE